MKKIGQIINNTNNNVINQMKYVYKVWYNAVTEDIKAVTTPYEYNKDTGSLIVSVHDNLWYTDLTYMEDDFITQLNKFGLSLNHITFKYAPKYEKLEKTNSKYYNISKRAEDYINHTAGMFENKVVSSHFKNFLINFFHNNNFDDWILKG